MISLTYTHITHGKKNRKFKKNQLRQTFKGNYEMSLCKECKRKRGKRRRERKQQSLPIPFWQAAHKILQEPYKMDTRQGVCQPELNRDTGLKMKLSTQKYLDSKMSLNRDLIVFKTKKHLSPQYVKKEKIATVRFVSLHPTLFSSASTFILKQTPFTPVLHMLSPLRLNGK